MRAHEFIAEHRLVWRRNKRTGQISMAWRCEGGPRNNRTVPEIGHCGLSPDLEKRQRMKITRARTKIRQARKTKRTKRINPSSKLIARLNKYL